MTKLKKIISVLVLASVSLAGAFAEEENEKSSSGFYLLHNWGVSVSSVTRLQLNTTRSNFVWQDDMLGLYYEVQSKSLPVNFIAKLSVFYPYHSSFNQMDQKAKQVILYAFDLTVGPYWSIPLWEFAILDLAPVVNVRYQLDDNFHHVDLGLGGRLGLEFPVSRKFSILLNGTFTYDFANLGSNAKIRPYDHAWTYAADLGFRVSKKHPNSIFYINPRGKASE